MILFVPDKHRFGKKRVELGGVYSDLIRILYTRLFIVLSAHTFLSLSLLLLFFLTSSLKNGTFCNFLTRLSRGWDDDDVLYLYAVQAAQATFKSIKSLVPLLDRVLVQRFKHETVRLHTSIFSSHIFQPFFFFRRKRQRVYSSRRPRRPALSQRLQLSP